LTELYLNDNELTTLPDSIGNLANLTHLSLSDNPIDTEHPEIQERILLRIQIRNQIRNNPTPNGIAFNIHNAFRKINTDKLTSYIKQDTVCPSLNNSEFTLYVDDILNKFLISSYDNINKDFDNAEQLKIKTQYTAIFNSVLSKINYDNYKELIYYVFEYVKKQSNEFRYKYVYYFTYDNYNAYNSSAGCLSCASGMLERFITTLQSVAEMIQFTSHTSEYSELLNIFNYKSINQLILKYMQVHYNKVKDSDTESSITEKMEYIHTAIRDDIIEYFKNNTSEIPSNIDELIHQEIQILREIF
jgi:Leucine-rich repeat (LRR) protein